MFHVRTLKMFLKTLKMFLKFPFKSLDRLQVSYWLWKEVPQHCWRHRLQNSRFFFFFSKSVKKLVKHSLRVLRARSARASHVLRQPRPQGFFLKKWVREKPWGRGWSYGRVTGVWRVCLSPVSLSVFSFVQGLLFDFSRVLEYAKIRTVLQSDLLTPRQTTDHRRT